MVGGDDDGATMGASSPEEVDEGVEVAEPENLGEGAAHEVFVDGVDHDAHRRRLIFAEPPAWLTGRRRPRPISWRLRSVDFESFRVQI
jgi:hypothetical protein